MKRRETPIERLVDAEPQFYSMGNDPQRRRIGLTFACPIHEHCYLAVAFANPLDGADPEPGRPLWAREGADFETLTVTPSIRILGGPDGCRWHGFVRQGHFETCGDAE